MISLPKHSWILAAGFLGCVACGGGGGGDGGSGNGGDAEIVRLAVGYRFVDPELSASRALILRNSGGEWVSVGDAVLGASLLDDVLFASSDVAWAWGSFAVFRSRDAGRTWEDVKVSFPQPIRDGVYVLESFAFADATTGYFAASSIPVVGAQSEGPFVWSTRDGGDTWQEVASAPTRLAHPTFALGVRAGIPELLRFPATTGCCSADVQRLDRAEYEAEAVTSLSVLLDASGFSTVGERGWVALRASPDSEHVRPAIFTSARPGAPWTPQAVPEAEASEFGKIDLCDESVGIAGGNGRGSGALPVVFWTDDGGARWGRSTSDLPATSVLGDTLCVRADEMWLVGNETNESIWTRSDDGGRSFQQVVSPLDVRNGIYGLATNAGFQ